MISRGDWRDRSPRDRRIGARGRWAARNTGGLERFGGLSNRRRSLFSFRARAGIWVSRRISFQRRSRRFIRRRRCARSPPSLHPNCPFARGGPTARPPPKVRFTRRARHFLLAQLVPNTLRNAPSCVSNPITFATGGHQVYINSRIDTGSLFLSGARKSSQRRPCRSCAIAVSGQGITEDDPTATVSVYRTNY